MWTLGAIDLEPSKAKLAGGGGDRGAGISHTIVAAIVAVDCRF
jgi:hypothetical protein